MYLNLKQIIKLLKICRHANIKSFDEGTAIYYRGILKDIIVQNDKAEILFSDFMLLIRFFGCEDYAYFTEEKFANFIIQNIKQKFLNAVEEKNNSNIISTENKILYDDTSDKLTPDKMMLIKSKTFMTSRCDIDKWIWQQFVDSKWDLEQVFNFFKLNGDLYPFSETYNSPVNEEMVDIDHAFVNMCIGSKELVNAIKKKMDLYAKQILSDEKTDYLTLEEIKVIAISNFNFIQNHELKEKFLNRIPKQIDFCYFRYFVSIFVRKELAEQNLIDQEFINSYMDRVKTNSKCEKQALDKIKEAKQEFELRTPKATNLRIEEDWEMFKTAEYSDDRYYALRSIADNLTYQHQPGILDSDLANKIISEMPMFKDQDVRIREKLQSILGLIKANGKNNTGRPWYVILGHILTLGIFLWGPLPFKCMFGCCHEETKESNLKKIGVTATNSNTNNNQLSIVSTIDTIIQSSNLKK